MKKRFSIWNAVLHLAVWVAVFVVNTVLIQGYAGRIDWTYVAICCGLCLFVFYANYLLLIPLLLGRRRWVPVYALLALGMLAASFYGIKHAAIRSAQNHVDRLWEQEQQYTDEFRDRVADKERLRENQRNIERRRQREQQPRDPADSLRRARFAESFGMIGVDSATLAQMRQRQDSIVAIPVEFTARDEEYRLLRRELRLAEAYRRRLAPLSNEGGRPPQENSDMFYNPLGQNNLQFVFALFFFYMASVVAFFAEQTVRSERRRREIEREKANAELAYLKQQINPHFLFNTLNSIYSYTIGVSNEASDAVLKLSSILRYMLYETNRDRVPLSDELAVLDNYIDLQRLRITDKTQIDVLVTGDTHLHRIEPMLLIPIIENAFKYGVDSVEPSFVRIEIESAGSRFTFRVSNKVVRRNDGDTSNSGIGLKNIRRRLELIYGPGRYTMNVQEKGGIFSVTLQLNLAD
jgi:hypothetical protein